MAAITPSYTIVNPSYIAPELIIGYPYRCVND